MQKILIILALLLPMPAAAGDDIWAQIASKGGVEIKTTTGTDGKPRRTATLAGPVTVTEGDNGRVSIVDKSGKGAVMCAWMIHASTRSLLHSCYKDSHPNYKKAYDTALPRIRAFIAANSLTPVTAAEIEEKENQAFAQGTQGATPEQICASPLLPARDKDLEPEKIDSFLQHIDDMLSIPRLPASEPCM